MNLLQALVRWLAIELSQEIAKKDHEIAKLKTALAGAQEENRQAWQAITELKSSDG